MMECQSRLKHSIAVSDPLFVLTEHDCLFRPTSGHPHNCRYAQRLTRVRQSFLATLTLIQVRIFAGKLASVSLYFPFRTDLEPNCNNHRLSYGAGELKDICTCPLHTSLTSLWLFWDASCRAFTDSMVSRGIVRFSIAIVHRMYTICFFFLNNFVLVKNCN